MDNKRGISAIVATVLIILITFVAVTIIWLVILPVVQNSVASVEEEASLSILTTQGYTVFDSVKQIAAVQVKRGVDNTNLTKLEIIFDINGTSKTFTTKSAPEINGEKTYWFNFSNYADLVNKTPSGVSVVPVYLQNGVEVLGKILSNVKIPLRTILLEPGQLAVILSKPENVPTPKYPAPGDAPTGCISACGSGYRCVSRACVPISPITGGVIKEIDSCRELNESYVTYKLNKSITGRTGTCFTIKNNSIILDMDGYNITGDDSGTDHGVYVNNYDDVTIKNGFIYGFNYGVKFVSSSNNQILGVTVTKNIYGVFLEASSFNNLSQINANFNNNSGISLKSNSNNNQLSEITANYNRNKTNFPYSFGIFLDQSSSNQLSGVTALYNYVGVYINSISSFNNLSQINANFNYFGVYIESSSFNNLSQINANSNIVSGIGLDLSSNNKLSNIITNNQTGIDFMGEDELGRLYVAYGLYIISSSNNQISNAESSLGGSTPILFDMIRYGYVHGVYIESSLNNTLSNIKSNKNKESGLVLKNSPNNTITDSIINSNGWMGIRNILSNNTQIYNVTIINNSNGGISMSSGSFGNFTKVYSCGNTVYDFKCFSTSSIGMVGYNNNFSIISGVCSNPTWPVLNTHYTNCPA